MSARLAAMALLALTVIGCAIPIAPPGAGPTTAAPDALTISVRESTYGRIVVETRPAAECNVTIELDPGEFGDRPALSFNGDADETGRLEWSYPAPPQPAQRAEYLVSCSADGKAAQQRSPFPIEARAPKAASFTVRVTVAEPSPGVVADPSLVPLRDALLERLRSGLAQEWSRATRGLGSVRVVEEPADVLVKVIAARSTSVHRSSPRDGSQEILIYVAGDGGVVDLENLVATVLHELGHVWCCAGPEADAGGHWAQSIADPELAGVDRFGLMNHPVRCTDFGAVLSCPNLFSRRELVALGFTDIPPPPPDPCLTQATPLEARIAELDRLLAAERAAIAAAEARLNTLSARIAEIERRYGRSRPPDVDAEYNALIAEHNGLLPRYRTDVAEHNAYVAERNELVAARRALPC